MLLGCCLLSGEICEGPRKVGAAAQPRGEPAFSYAAQPLSFEVNQGQTDKTVDFTAHGKGYGLFLTRDEMVLELQKSGVRSQGSECRSERPQFGDCGAGDRPERPGDGHPWVLLAAGLSLVMELAGCSGANNGCGGDQDCVLKHSGSFQLVTLKGTATAGSTTLTNSTTTELYVPNPD